MYEGVVKVALLGGQLRRPFPGKNRFCSLAHPGVGQHGVVPPQRVPHVHIHCPQVGPKEACYNPGIGQHGGVPPHSVPHVHIHCPQVGPKEAYIL